MTSGEVQHLQARYGGWAVGRGRGDWYATQLDAGVVRVDGQAFSIKVASGNLLLGNEACTTSQTAPEYDGRVRPCPDSYSYIFFSRYRF